MTEDAGNALVACRWSGNVRELENFIQRAVHQFEGPALDVEHLRFPQAGIEKAWQAGTLEEMNRLILGCLFQ